MILKYLEIPIVNWNSLLMLTRWEDMKQMN